MDNKQYSEQEESGFTPGEQSAIPLPEEIPELPDPQDSPALPTEETKVFEKIPEELPTPDIFTDPALGTEITPDENAMAFHGMTDHGEPEQPFDLSILDDPELDILTAEEPQEESEPIDLFPEPPAVDLDYREAGEDFEEMMDAPAEEKPIPTHDRPTRKGRPKRRRGEFLFGLPGIATTVIWLAITLAIGVTLGRMLWAAASDVLAFGRQDKAVTITIYQSDTIEEITDKLHKGGLIRYPGLFKLYASLAVDEGEIQPGIWDLNTLYDYHALVNMMSPSSTRQEIEITIPEGYTCRQIFALLEEHKVATAVDLAAWAASGELDEYWFLEGVERGEENCLEGYLFPDTYRFYKNSSPREALQKMLDNFDYRFTEDMRAQLDTLNANVTGGTFTIQDVVIVASLIEKETSSSKESPKIASVIYNRLFDWGGNPAYLNIDASIVYALDGKTDLTAEDLQIDHPYNTYKNTGLTPGPISNPGLSSLKAALDPDETNYYFYVLDPAEGSHIFTTTYEEHQAAIASVED